MTKDIHFHHIDNLDSNEMLGKDSFLLKDRGHAKLCASHTFDNDSIDIVSTDNVVFTVSRVLAVKVSGLLSRLYNKKIKPEGISWKEKREKRFLSPFPSNVLTIITRFINMGKANSNSNIILKIINAASYFLIDSLYASAWEAVESTLSPRNALKIYEASRAFNYISVLRKSWRLLGLYDVKALFFESEDFLQLGLNTILHFLQHRQNLKICCEAYIVSRIFDYFDHNVTLPKRRLCQIIFTPSIINFFCIDIEFWKELLHHLNPDYQSIARLALEFRSQSTSFIKDQDILSSSFNGNNFPCANCQSVANVSLEVKGNICCSNCWTTVVQPYNINLTNFSMKKRKKPKKECVEGKLSLRLDSNSQIDLSRRGTFVSVASGAIEKKSQRVTNTLLHGSSFFPNSKNDMVLVQPGRVKVSSRSYDVHARLEARNFKPRFGLNSLPKLKRTNFASGRYCLSTLVGFKWDRVIADISLGSDLSIQATGYDAEGVFSIDGSCEDGKFEFYQMKGEEKNHYLVVDQERNDLSTFIGAWNLCSKENQFKVDSSIHTKGYFSLTPCSQQVHGLQQTLPIDEIKIALKRREQLVIETSSDELEIAVLNFGDDMNNTCPFGHKLIGFPSLEVALVNLDIEEGEIVSRATCFKSGKKPKDSPFVLCLHCLREESKFLFLATQEVQDQKSSPVLSSTRLKKIESPSFYQELPIFKSAGCASCSLCNSLIDVQASDSSDFKKNYMTAKKEIVCSLCGEMPTLCIKSGQGIVEGYVLQEGIKVIQNKETYFLTSSFNDIQLLQVMQHETRAVDKCRVFLKSKDKRRELEIGSHRFTHQTPVTTDTLNASCKYCKGLSFAPEKVLSLLERFTMCRDHQLLALLQDFILQNLEECISVQLEKDIGFSYRLFEISPFVASLVIGRALRNEMQKKLIAKDLESTLNLLVSDISDVDHDFTGGALSLMGSILFLSTDEGYLWNLFPKIIQNRFKDFLLELVLNPKIQVLPSEIHRIGRLIASLLTVLGVRGWQECTTFLQKPLIECQKTAMFMAVFFSSLSEPMMEEHGCNEVLRDLMIGNIVHKAKSLPSIVINSMEGQIIASAIEENITKFYERDHSNKFNLSDSTLIGIIITSFGWKLEHITVTKTFLDEMTSAVAGIFHFALFLTVNNMTDLADAAFYHSLIKFGKFLIDNSQKSTKMVQVSKNVIVPALVLIMSEQRLLTRYYHDFGDFFATFLANAVTLSILEPKDTRQYFLYFVQKIQKSITSNINKSAYLSLIAWCDTLSHSLRYMLNEVDMFIEDEWFVEELSLSGPPEYSLLLDLCCFASAFHNIGEHHDTLEIANERRTAVCEKFLRSIPLTFLKRGRHPHTRVVIRDNPVIRPKREVKRMIENEILSLQHLLTNDNSFILLFDKVLLPIIEYLAQPEYNSPNEIELSLRFVALASLFKHQPLENVGIVSKDSISLMVLFLLNSVFEQLENLISPMQVESALKLMVTFCKRLEEDSHLPHLENLYLEYSREAEHCTEQMMNRLLFIACNQLKSYSQKELLREFASICDALVSLSLKASESWFLHFRHTVDMFLDTFIKNLQKDNQVSSCALQKLHIFYSCFQDVSSRFEPKASYANEGNSVEILLRFLLYLVTSPSTDNMLHRPIVRKEKKVLHLKQKLDTVKDDELFEDKDFIKAKEAIVSHTLEVLINLFNESSGQFASKNYLIAELFSPMLYARESIARTASSLFTLCVTNSILTSNQTLNLLLCTFSMLDESNGSLPLELDIVKLLQKIIYQKSSALQDQSNRILMAINVIVLRASTLLRPNYSYNHEYCTLFHIEILSLLKVFLKRFEISQACSFILEYLANIVPIFTPGMLRTRRDRKRSSSVSSAVVMEESSEDSLILAVHDVLDRLLQGGLDHIKIKQVRQLLPEQTKKIKKPENLFANLFGL